jgi:rod shape determining protein RodA
MPRGVFALAERRNFMKKIFREIKEYCRHADLALFLLALTCCLLGLVMIYSATFSYHSNRYLVVQTAAMGLGIFCYIVASLIDFENLSRFWKIFFVLNLLLQLTIIPFGSEGDTGNRSWIRFDSIGLGIQPAEFGKVIFIFTFAAHINRLKDKLNSLFSVAQLVVHFGVIVAAVYLPTKDLGMAVAYVLIFAVMMFSSGLNWKWVGGMGLAGVVSIPILWNFLETYQRNRILVLFDPAIDESIYWQTGRSVLALGSGQLLGTGYLQGRQTQGNRLPAKYTDSIFSVIGEEFGFIGCCVVMILLAALVFRVFYDAAHCDSRFSYMMCAGIGSMFMVQIIINIGMCVGVAPVIGLTLPFFSYGGSSIVTVFGALGIVAGFVLRQRPAWLRDSDPDA